MIIPVERVTTALIEMLAAEVGVPVGDHGTKSLDGTPIDTTSRYLIARKIEGGAVDGSLGDPAQTATLVYQVDAFGRSRQQAEGVADLARNVITGVDPVGGHTHPLSGPGWRAGLRAVQTLSGGPEDEGVDEQKTPVWGARGDRYEIEVVPAPVAV